MDYLPPISTLTMAAGALLLTLMGLRMRQRAGTRQTAASREALDTVADWPPEAARVLSISERQAHDLLKRAMPGFLVLAQVPLSRFIRVPTSRPYGEWLQRVGSLSADLLLCDSGSRVLAVIDIRAPQETERSRRRHERMARVLRAAGIRVHTWREGQLPSVAEVRLELTQSLGAAASAARGGTVPRPMPLIPVPEMCEMDELLAAGDRAALVADVAHEPVPSAFFDDLQGSARG